MLMKLALLGMSVFSLVIALYAVKGLFVSEKDFDDHLSDCLDYVLGMGFVAIVTMFIYSIVNFFI